MMRRNELTIGAGNGGRAGAQIYSSGRHGRPTAATVVLHATKQNNSRVVAPKNRPDAQLLRRLTARAA